MRVEQTPASKRRESYGGIVAGNTAGHKGHRVAAAMGAVMLVGATAFAPIAHADPDTDYINYLKRHGLYPTSGVSESEWERKMIAAGHNVCEMTALGYTREGIKAHEKAEHPDSSHTIDAIVDGAVATYCPQYW
jgi:hypothetical protein